MSSLVEKKFADGMAHRSGLAVDQIRRVIAYWPAGNDSAMHFYRGMAVKYFRRFRQILLFE